MQSDLLAPERIRINLDEPTKKRTLEIIAELCAPEKQQSSFFQALVDREKLGSTGLGQGVALPHARIKGLDKPIACFLQMKKPIQFDGIDQEPVDLIFGLLVPEGGQEEHLQMLADIASIFNQTQVRAALRATHSSEDAFKIITQAKGDAALAS
jgi:PTS system nitrogen regulatory IIA component